MVARPGIPLGARVRGKAWFKFLKIVRWTSEFLWVQRRGKSRIHFLKYILLGTQKAIKKAQNFLTETQATDNVLSNIIFYLCHYHLWQ